MTTSFSVLITDKDINTVFYFYLFIFKYTYILFTYTDFTNLDKEFFFHLLLSRDNNNQFIFSYL